MARPILIPKPGTMIFELNPSPRWLGPLLFPGIILQGLALVLLIFLSRQKHHFTRTLSWVLLCCGTLSLCLLGLFDADYTLLLGELILLPVFWRLTRQSQG